MRTFAVLLLAGAVVAQDWPVPLRGQPWAVAKLMRAVDQGHWTALRRAGIRAAPTLLQRRHDDDPETRRQVVALLHRAYGFPIAAFRLENATLAEACAELTKLSGVTVRASGEGKRITLHQEPTDFWTAVLAICRKADVGLAPHPYKHDWGAPWIPGHRGNAVVLGPRFRKPEHAYVSGPVLVTLTAQAIRGERAGLLTMEARWVPELPARGMTTPAFRDGIDWER